MKTYHLRRILGLFLRVISTLWTRDPLVEYLHTPVNLMQPSLADDPAQGLPSSASFCSAVLGILATVAKEWNILQVAW